MKKIAIGTICALPFITTAVLLLACGEAPPQFDVVSLNIVPPEVTAGETATIWAEVRNSGGSEGTYDAVLTVDRAEGERQSTALAPGKSVTLTFPLVIYKPGYYEIAIGNRSSTLAVLEAPPPAFRVSHLEVDPEWVCPGEETTVTATIVNNGGTTGSYIAKLRIGDATEQETEVILSAGMDQTVTFLITIDTPGNYAVILGELTKQLVVLQPVEPIEIKINGFCGPARG